MRARLAKRHAVTYRLVTVLLPIGTVVTGSACDFSAAFSSSTAMKFQLVVFQLICLTVAWARTAVEDDLEEVPVQAFKPVKPNPLKSSKSIPVPTKKTTTPPPEVKSEPEQEPEYEDDQAPKEYEDEASQSSTTSTTEASKKIGNGIVRPFRSNQDLLETLKRRRAEKVAAGPQFAAPSTTSAPAAAAAAPAPRAKKPSRAYNGRSRSQSPEEPDQAGSESEKTTVNRRFSGARGRSSFSSTTPAYVEEVPEEAPAPPPRNRNFGRSRRV